MPEKKVYSNHSGTSRGAFSIGIGAQGVEVGAIDKPGTLQGRDADKRTVRDIVQYGPRYVVAEGYNQVATEFEIHDLSVAIGRITLLAGATYTLDEGAILVV